jgi:uncharacterized membrane protein YphA (DoxX/SURF4 family)
MEDVVSALATGYAELVMRFLLATVFLLAGAAKVGRGAQFERAVRQYRLMPDWAVRPFAVALPRVEFSLGLFLALGIATRVAAAFVLALLTVFSVAISINLARGRVIDCGCTTSVTPQKITWRTVARDTALASLALLVVAGSPDVLSLAALGGSSSSINSADALAVAITTSMCLALVPLTRESARIAALMRSRTAVK